MFLLNKTEKKANHQKTGHLQNPKILDVNLIKDEAHISFDWSKNFLFLGLVLGLAFLLVLELYWGLDWWLRTEEEKLQVLVTETDSLNQETVKLKNAASDAINYKDKVLIFDDLLSRHVYWGPFFSWLEKKTLSTVQYEGFRGGLSGVYELRARAHSYSDASWQASVFLKEPVVKQVAIQEVSAEFTDGASEADGVTFNLNLEINPDIFRK